MDNKRKTTSKPVKRKPRINISHLLIVILGALLILSLIIYGISCLFATADSTVKKAYVKTMKQIAISDGFMEQLIDEDTIKRVKEDSTAQNLSLTINNVSNNEKLASTGITAQIKQNSKKSQGNIDFSATYQSTPLLSIQGFTDNKTVLISAPQLYSKTFSMASDNIMKQHSESVMGQDIQYTDLQDFSIKVFNEDQDIEVLHILDQIKKEFVEIYNKQFERLADKMTYEKLEEKQDITINNETVSCKGYSVTAQSSDVKAFVMELLKEVRTNSKIRSLVEEYAEIQFQAVPLYQLMIEDSDYIVDNYYKNLDALLEKINNSEFNDTSANVYIYNGIIVKAGARSIYTNAEERFVIQLIGGLTGGKNPYEDFNFSINLQDENQMLKLDMVGSTDTVDGVITKNRTYTIGNGTDDLVFVANLDYNQKDNSFTADTSLTTPEGNYISLNGKGTAVKQRKNLTITADEINLDYNNIFTANLSGSYSVSNLKDKIVKPEGEAVEIFKVDEATLNQIKTEIAENIKGMVAMTGVNEPQENPEVTTAQ